MTRRRETILALVTVLGTVTLCLGIAEVVLRFLPVCSAWLAMPVTAESPVFHYMPNRDFVYSKNWDMKLVNYAHINNAGFFNDQNYQENDKTPLLAVIGDSYIEATMVPYAATLHGRLATGLEGRVRVYSFGASSAPLSQYLVWAHHAVRDLGAKALVINVIGNDFDESLAAYSNRLGFWLYMTDADGDLRLRLFEYRPGPVRDLLAMSALARYSILNLNLREHLSDLRALLLGSPANATPRYAGNTLADTNPARVSASMAAIDAFLRDLADFVGLSPDRVTFTMDGFRYPEAAVQGANTYFDIMRRAFRTKAEALGYEVIDLDPLFLARHRRTGERFEYSSDSHWSPTGHEVAYQAVMSSRLLAQLSR
jgi:hypothetical protein